MVILRNNCLWITGKFLFFMYDTYGMPIEYTKRLMEKHWKILYEHARYKQIEQYHTWLTQVFKGGFNNG